MNKHHLPNYNQHLPMLRDNYSIIRRCIVTMIIAGFCLLPSFRIFTGIAYITRPSLLSCNPWTASRETSSRTRTASLVWGFGNKNPDISFSCCNHINPPHKDKKRKRRIDKENSKTSDDLKALARSLSLSVCICISHSRAHIIHRSWSHCHQALAVIPSSKKPAEHATVCRRRRRPRSTPCRTLSSAAALRDNNLVCCLRAARLFHRKGRF